MNLFTKARRPKRATGSEPALLDPKTWNALVDYVEMMETCIRQIQPQSSADIKVTTITGGTTFELARKGGSSSSSSLHHQWKTSDAGLIEDSQSWSVKGGTVWDHLPSGIVEEVEVFDTIVVADSVVALDVGIIYLEVARNSTTRKITGVSVSGAVGTIDEETGKLASHNILPANGPDYQYFPLSIVGTTPRVIQLQFQEIKVFEMLIVSNGEFKLGNFQMMGLTNYDLPEVSPEPPP